MRILILGGTTLTEPYVVRWLHSLGHDITVFHRGVHEDELPRGVRHLHGDLALLPREVFDPAPDVVVHMWAMTEMAAESFLERFRGVASRAVVISSGDVYRAYGRLMDLESGPPDPIPLTEDAPLRESRYPYRKMAPNPDHWKHNTTKFWSNMFLCNAPDGSANVCTPISSGSGAQGVSPISALVTADAVRRHGIAYSRRLGKLALDSRFRRGCRRSCGPRRFQFVVRGAD